MTINMSFNSYEEVVAFARMIARESAEPIKVASVPKETKTTKKQEAPVQEDTSAVEEAPTAQQYTLEDVRAALGALTKAGKRDQVKDLLQSFGAAKLPEVNPDDYPSLMAKAGELNAQ